MEKSSFEYTWYMPTKIVSGRDCVKNNALLLSPLGKRALIVTGKSSAANGSLADMCAALRENEQEFEVFDEVTPNPVVACVQKGAAKAREMRADFIIGIGGGSPMDAAKAIAALARQPRTDEGIFSRRRSADYGRHGQRSHSVCDRHERFQEDKNELVLSRDVSEARFPRREVYAFPA